MLLSSNTADEEAAEAAAEASSDEAPLQERSDGVPNPGTTHVVPRSAGCVLLPAILAFSAHLTFCLLLLSKWEALEDLELWKGKHAANDGTHMAFGNFTSMRTGWMMAGVSWYSVFAPAWTCEFISAFFALIALLNSHVRTGNSARNVACMHLNSLLQAVFTATFELLLVLRLVNMETPDWSVVFLPWYLAMVIQVSRRARPSWHPRMSESCSTDGHA